MMDALSMRSRARNFSARGQKWSSVRAGPSKVPTLPITPPTSLPAVAPPAIPLSKEMEGSSSQAQQRERRQGGRHRVWAAQREAAPRAGAWQAARCGVGARE